MQAAATHIIRKDAHLSEEHSPACTSQRAHPCPLRRRTSEAGVRCGNLHLCLKGDDGSPFLARSSRPDLPHDGQVSSCSCISALSANASSLSTAVNLIGMISADVLHVNLDLPGIVDVRNRHQSIVAMVEIPLYSALVGQGKLFPRPLWRNEARGIPRFSISNGVQLPELLMCRNSSGGWLQGS
jgi:hypothetical protein